MSVQPHEYGSNSPFSAEERETVEAIYAEVKASNLPEAEEIWLAIDQQIRCLNRLGGVLAEYPSPFGDQRLGRRERGLDTLVDALSRTTPANFELHVPTRALLGRAVDMAETNFYRLLRHICADLLTGERADHLREQASVRLRVCLYTKIAEEVLSGIASDDQLDHLVRREAVLALAQIWDRRLSYRVCDFFPILDAAWEARRRITVTGGTLAGTQEVFELFQEGCDPEFVDYFTRLDPTADEIEAFREFLFATSAEILSRLASQMVDDDVYSVSLPDTVKAAMREDPTLFYEFFRSRQLLANARRLSQQQGPKRTAESYVMIDYLRKTVTDSSET
jgi:hypothetical protein